MPRARALLQLTDNDVGLDAKTLKRLVREIIDLVSRKSSGEEQSAERMERLTDEDLLPIIAREHSHSTVYFAAFLAMMELDEIEFHLSEKKECLPDFLDTYNMVLTLGQSVSLLPLYSADTNDRFEKYYEFRYDQKWESVLKPGVIAPLSKEGNIPCLFPVFLADDDSYRIISSYRKFIFVGPHQNLERNKRLLQLVNVSDTPFELLSTDLAGTERLLPAKEVDKLEQLAQATILRSLRNPIADVAQLPLPGRIKNELKLKLKM